MSLHILSWEWCPVHNTGHTSGPSRAGAHPFFFRATHSFSWSGKAVEGFTVVCKTDGPSPELLCITPVFDKCSQSDLDAYSFSESSLNIRHFFCSMGGRSLCHNTLSVTLLTWEITAMVLSLLRSLASPFLKIGAFLVCRQLFFIFVNIFLFGFWQIQSLCLMMVPLAKTRVKLRERSFILSECEIPAAYSDRKGHWQLESLEWSLGGEGDLQVRKYKVVSGWAYLISLC